jgi:hypothetical protein
MSLIYKKNQDNLVHTHMGYISLFSFSFLRPYEFNKMNQGNLTLSTLMICSSQNNKNKNKNKISYHIWYRIFMALRKRNFWDLQYAFCKLDRYIKKQFYSNFLYMIKQSHSLRAGLRVFFLTKKKKPFKCCQCVL